MVEDLIRRVEEERKRKFERFLSLLIQHLPNSTIILFGSRARGSSKPNSDFDVIVVTPCDDTVEKQIEIYKTTRPDTEVDVVVIRPDEVNEKNVNLAHMLYKGYKILYDGLKLEAKIEKMIEVNAKRIKEILPYDDE